MLFRSITGSSGWATRIRFYRMVKPDMRHALIPVSSLLMQTDIDEMGALLHDHGVTPHVVKIHDEAEMLYAITHYSDRIDSLICPQDNLCSGMASRLAAACAQHGITYFSPFPADVQNGAAMAVSCSDMKIGWHAAQKTILLLEEHKTPADIPLTNIGTDAPYHAHFNQLAMRAQGLDPSLITSLALKHGSRIHVPLKEVRSP